MKKGSIKKLISFLLGLVMVVGMVGCGKSTKDQEVLKPTDGNKLALADQQVFKTYISEEPTILDPWQYQDDNAASVIAAVHEPLLRTAGENGVDWEPGLATDYKMNDDATVHTITLRKNAVWSDGSPITAKDVVYSFQRVVDPKFASPKAFEYYKIKNAEKIVKGEIDKSELGVKALDEYTVEITTGTPVDYFVDFLKNPMSCPIQKAAGEAYGDLYGTEIENMVFSGPFVLKEWTHDNSMLLVKNDKYWDADNVKLERIEISLTSDTNSLTGMYQTGDLDFMKVSVDMLPKYQNEKGFIQSQRIRVSFIEFNPRVEFLNNIKIREALSIAFDRQTYATNVIKQPGAAAYGLVPYGVRGKNGGDFREQQGNLVVDTATDPNAIGRAKKLLQEGLAELGKTQKNFEDFLQVLCIDSESSKLQAQAIQAMWKENLGLNIQVVPMQTKMLIPMLVEGTFHCVIGGGRSASFPDASTFIDFIYDEGKWDDAKFIKLMEDSFVQTGSERIATLMEAEKYVLNNFVYIPQVYGINNYVVSEHVEGLKIWPFGYEFDYKYLYITK